VTTPDDDSDGADGSITPVGRDSATEGASVTAGVLDAERRARDQIARRRRLLLGGAVLGLVIAGAVLAVMTVLQQRANREAALEADQAEARATFAMAVVDRAEAYEPPATSVQRETAALRTAMEEFLSETVVDDAELVRQVDIRIATLDDEAATVAGLLQRDVPEPPELVDAGRAVVVLRELETLRAEADALADEIPVATVDARTWTDAVRTVNDAVAAHVEQVESEEPTSDPQELDALWRAEQPALRQLSTAAAAAADVAGLEAWAAAHEAYARDLLDWIDEAVALLEAGELEAYNTRFEQVFATDDPFGFAAGVAASTESALASPALLQLGTLDQRAQLVLDRVTSTEVVTAEQLDDAVDPGT
jgi:hypothetical protein